MTISSHPFLHDPNILRFQVKVHGRLFNMDLVADTYIDPDNITSEYAKQPALLAWYGVVYNHASYAYEKAKTELDIFEARACGEVRKLIDKKEKVTETFIKQYVMADEDYISRRFALDELHAQADLAKRAFEAIKEKGSALVSLGAHIRSEVESLGREYLRTKGGT